MSAGMSAASVRPLPYGVFFVHCGCCRARTARETPAEQQWARGQGRRSTLRSQTQRLGSSTGPGATIAVSGGAPVGYSVDITSS